MLIFFSVTHESKCVTLWCIDFRHKRLIACTLHRTSSSTSTHAVTCVSAHIWQPVYTHVLVLMRTPMCLLGLFLQLQCGQRSSASTPETAIEFGPNAIPPFAFLNASPSYPGLLSRLCPRPFLQPYLHQTWAQFHGGQNGNLCKTFKRATARGSDAQTLNRVTWWNLNISGLSQCHQI